ncbi:MAG: hypothetical protein J5I59_12870 [Saprospiraceae bacterium]|nr:hypothetical protein [Saprospiraceae bacterium]
MKRIQFAIFITLSWLLSQDLYSQSALDVLRLSDQTLIGTGRAAGTNTSMSGIGADFTTLSSNPAGIAQYRMSEIMLSPTVISTNSKMQLTSGSERPEVTDNKTKFRLPNLGLIFAKNGDEKVSYAFGAGINGYLDHSQYAIFRGKSQGSITERFAALANGLDTSQLDPFEAGLAWNTQALVQRRPDGSYSYDYEDYKDVELNKYQSIQASGRYNEMAFSGGINLDNKLLVGATIGVPTFKYNERKLYQERDDQEAIPFFDQLQFREYKAASGIGINGKLGLMFKPVNSLIIGAAIHSPSFIKVTDNFSTDLRYNFTYNSDSYSLYSESPEGTIDYKIRTPMKLSGSLGGIIGKFGFVNAEVEYQDYAQGHMRIVSDNLFDKEVEDKINDEIKANYTSAIKVRLGLEIAAVKHFRMRAGIGFDQSPYVNQRDFKPNFGFGLGYRSDFFFLDLGYRRWESTSGYQPYFISQASQTIVTQDLSQNAIVLTLGFKMH